MPLGREECRVVHPIYKLPPGSQPPIKGQPPPSNGSIGYRLLFVVGYGRLEQRGEGLAPCLNFRFASFDWM